MNSIINYINEAKDNQKWVAIEVTTINQAFQDTKQSTSQRVVSWDTYQEMKSTGKTKSGYVKILSVETLGPATRNKEQAMSYLDSKPKSVRKSKINKGDADYVVWCIPSGKFTATGKTSWDWNLWEEQKDGELYFGLRGGVLFGTKGSLKEGDKLYCIDNDSQKKLSGAPNEVALVCDCDLEAFRKAYREKWPEQCKRPSRQFGKVSDGLPWNRFGQMYSIKGVAEEV